METRRVPHGTDLRLVSIISKVRIPQRNVSHRKRFTFDNNVAKKSVTQELAAASGVPPAFRKQLEPCCTFPHVRKGCRLRAAELLCDALRYGLVIHTAYYVICIIARALVSFKEKQNDTRKQASPPPHCRVLPPGKFNDMITRPCILKVSRREYCNHFPVIVTKR